MAITPGTPITSFPIPTADAAANKTDILAALGAARLTGGNIFTGTQQNSGIVTSSAALGTDPTQFPTQAQVRSINAPAYVEPLIDWHFGAWTGTGVLASRGFKTGADLTFTGTPTEIETRHGLERQFTNTQYAVGNTTSKELFERVGQGKPFTLVIEGEELLLSTPIAVRWLFQNGDQNAPSTNAGLNIMQDSGLGGIWVARVITPLGGAQVILTTNTLPSSSPLVKLILSGSSTSPLTGVFTTAEGYVRKVVDVVIPTNTSVGAMAPQINRRISGNYSTSKIHRIRLYDRILDI